MLTTNAFVCILWKYLVRLSNVNKQQMTIMKKIHMKMKKAYIFQYFLPGKRSHPRLKRRRRFATGPDCNFFNKKKSTKNVIEKVLSAR